MEDSAVELELATCDLSELIPEDFCRWVSDAVVHCMTATEAGPRIDRYKLGDLVQRHFERLVVDDRFDFAPILAGLCRIPGVTEASLFVGVVNLRQRLALLNIDMPLPKMQLDDATRAQLVRQAREATEVARQEHAQRRSGLAGPSRQIPLGDLLVQEQLVTEVELAEALELQQQCGGRLGSNLVQLGFISESELARFLGRQLDIPCVTEIKHISADALAAIPSPLLSKYRVVPLSCDARHIQLAMVDPTDLRALDEIRFATGRNISAVVAPELVIEYARARFFRIRRQARLFVSPEMDEGIPFPQTKAVANAMAAEMTADLNDVAFDMLTCEDEDELFGVLWRLFTSKFQVVGELRVRRGIIQGTRFYGVRDAVAQTVRPRISASAHAVLDHVVTTKRVYSGPASPEIGGQWLSERLTIPGAAHVWILPVVAPHDEVVALFVGNELRGKLPEAGWFEAIQVGASATMQMVGARRTIRNIHNNRRPTVSVYDPAEL